MDSGNLNGDITLVEYFDYNCPICRGYAPTINALKAQYPNLKVIQRVVPVLAPSSIMIDSVILATKLQGKFIATEHAVLNLQLAETIPYPVLISILHNVGIDIPRLNSDLQTSSIKRVIQKNLQFYSALNVHQVPITVVYRTNNPANYLQFIGSQPYSQLNQAIQFFNNQKRK